MNVLEHPLSQSALPASPPENENSDIVANPIITTNAKINFFILSLLIDFKNLFYDDHLFNIGKISRNYSVEVNSAAY
jgi:hypothetical protein